MNLISTISLVELKREVEAEKCYPRWKQLEAFRQAADDVNKALTNELERFEELKRLVRAQEAENEKRGQSQRTEQGPDLDTSVKPNGQIINRTGRGGGTPKPDIDIVDPAPLNIVDPREDSAKQIRLAAQTFRYLWELPNAIVNEVNQIVVSPKRLLGEAIMLLTNKAFEQTADETEEEHQKRLTLWKLELEKWRDYLQTEIIKAESDPTLLEAQEAVWSLWVKRNESAGEVAWLQMLIQKRAQLQADCIALEKELKR